MLVLGEILWFGVDCGGRRSSDVWLGEGNARGQLGVVVRRASGGEGGGREGAPQPGGNLASVSERKQKPPPRYSEVNPMGHKGTDEFRIATRGPFEF